MNINRRELMKLSGMGVAGLAVTAPKIRSAFAGDIPQNQLADLSGNENPYGPAPLVKEALSGKIETVNRYFYAKQKELVKQIAEHEGVTMDHIVLGAGSSEVLCASILAYTSSEKRVLTADQSYSAIPAFTNGIGRKVVFVPVDDELKFDLNALYSRINNEIGLVYICNPNNPTGTMVDADKLRDFSASMPNNTIILIDEAYLEFSENFERDTMIDFVKKGHNVIVTRTFSKIHGLAGMRMGYSIAPPNISKNIVSHKMCKFMGPLGVVAASISLKQFEFHEFCRNKAKEGRNLVFNLCEQLGLDYAYGVGNFVFLDPKMPHAEFKKRMKMKGVDTARSFSPRKDWARITIGTTEEMNVFAKVFPEVINSYS